MSLETINQNANQHPKGYEAGVYRGIRKIVFSTSLEIIESSFPPTLQERRKYVIQMTKPSVTPPGTRTRTYLCIGNPLQPQKFSGLVHLLNHSLLPRPWSLSLQSANDSCHRLPSGPSQISYIIPSSPELHTRTPLLGCTLLLPNLSGGGGNSSLQKD